MLVKLLPEQIAQFWDIISRAIESSLPPIANEGYDKMNRILENLLNDIMQCWVSMYEKEDKNVIDSILVTAIMNDFCSSSKNLLIYCLYGFSVDSNSWKSGFDTLSLWAKSMGCIRIVAYTDVPRIKEVVTSLGGEAKYTFVSIPL